MIYRLNMTMYPLLCQSTKRVVLKMCAKSMRYWPNSVRHIHHPLINLLSPVGEQTWCEVSPRKNKSCMITTSLISRSFRVDIGWSYWYIYSIYLLIILLIILRLIFQMLVTEHHDVSLHEHADENASSLADVTKDPLVSVALVFSGSWARKLKSPPRCGNNKWSVTQQPQQPRVSKIKTQSHMAVCQNLVITPGEHQNSW